MTAREIADIRKQYEFCKHNNVKGIQADMFREEHFEPMLSALERLTQELKPLHGEGEEWPYVKYEAKEMGCPYAFNALIKRRLAAEKVKT